MGRARRRAVIVANRTNNRQRNRNRYQYTRLHSPRLHTCTNRHMQRRAAIRSLQPAPTKPVISLQPYATTPSAKHVTARERDNYELRNIRPDVTKGGAPAPTRIRSMRNRKHCASYTPFVSATCKTNGQRVNRGHIRPHARVYAPPDAVRRQRGRADRADVQRRHATHARVCQYTLRQRKRVIATQRTETKK